VPEQLEPLGKAEWAKLSVGGQRHLAEKVVKKLVGDELLLATLGPGRLAMELEKVWKDRDHIGVSELYGYCCRFLYLPVTPL
jgi:hypothetical protein